MFFELHARLPREGPGDDGERAEIDIARRFGDSFGYVFYAMRKRGA